MYRTDNGKLQVVRSKPRSPSRKMPRVRRAYEQGADTYGKKAFDHRSGTALPHANAKKNMFHPLHAADDEEYLYNDGAVRSLQTGSGYTVARQDKKGLLLKLITLFCVIMIALVLAAVLLSGRLEPSPDDPIVHISTGIHLEYDAFDDKTFIFIDGVLTDFTIDQSISAIKTNFEGNVCAMLTSDGILYYVTEKEVVQIADNVLNFELSNYGDAVAFVQHNGEPSDCTIQLYRLSQGEAVQIDSGADHQSIQLCLSPNGETLVYTRDAGERQGLYLYINDQLQYKASDINCPVVTDPGEIYAVDRSDNTLCFFDVNGGKTNIAADVYPIFRLNHDNTEIIFAAGKKWYISIQGKERVQIGNSAYFIPAGSHIASTAIYNSGSSHIVNYGVQTLLDHYYLTDGALVYLNKNSTVKEIVKNAENIQLCGEDGKLFYVRASKLYEAATDPSIEAKLVASNVAEYYLTQTGSVYYIDDFDFLWYKSDTDIRIVAKNVDQVVMAASDTLLFRTRDTSSESGSMNAGVLYSCKDGGTIRTISENVRSLTATETGIYYEVLHDSRLYLYDVYSSGGDTDFSRVLEKVGLLSIDDLIAKESDTDIVGTWFVAAYRLDGENTSMKQIEDLYGPETAAQYADLLLQFCDDKTAYSLNPLVWYRYEAAGSQITMTNASDSSVRTVYMEEQTIIWEVSRQNDHVLELVLQKEPVHISEENPQPAETNIFQENPANYSLQIAGISYRFPLQYTELDRLVADVEKAGWGCDTESSGQNIDAGSEKIIEYSGDGGSIQFVFYNGSDTEMALTDCPVTAAGISLMQETAFDVVLPGDVRFFNCSPEDIRSRYGTPSSMSMGDSGIVFTYKNGASVLTLLFTGEKEQVLTSVKIGENHP